MTKHPFLYAVLFALINAFMLAAMSLYAKMLSQYFGSIEVTFVRNIFSVIALFGFLFFSKKIDLLKTKKPLAHLFRGTIGTIGIVLGTLAVSMMPLSETTLLLFTSPLFVVLLSYPVLGEKVGIYRLSAVFIGFIGVFIIINPTSNTIDLPFWGIIAGIGWGFFSACVDICLRHMGKTENSTATVFYFVLFGTLVTGLHLPFAEMKQSGDMTTIFLIICGLGLSGLFSLLSKTQSFRLAEATLISPIMFTMIIWSLMFDYIFWDKVPALNTIAGAIIIIASNVFIIYREHILKKRKNLKKEI